MNAFIRYSEKKLLRIVFSPLKLLPIKNNRIFLINDLGYNYSCNTKALTEYLIKTYPNKFQIIYPVKSFDNNVPKDKGIVTVLHNSFKYFFYAMTARVIVSNSGGYSYIPLRKSQYVINTHHGGGAYKTAGADMFKMTKYLKKDLLLQSRQTDVFLSTNRKFSEVMSRACFLKKEKFWEIGMPRNDVLINYNPSLRNKIRNEIGLKANEKMVLYAPTYRKPQDNYYNQSIAISYQIDSNRVCRALEKRFGGKWIFAYRLHPCIINKSDFVVSDSIDLSNYSDMQDLLIAADVLINDFSSSFWDYMLTGKPSFLYAKDLNHYIETTKVYTPVSEWPFPKAISNEELVNNILTFDEKKYHEDCKMHYLALGGCETGRATELVCKLINEKCRW